MFLRRYWAAKAAWALGHIARVIDRPAEQARYWIDNCHAGNFRQPDWLVGATELAAGGLTGPAWLAGRTEAGGRSQNSQQPPAQRRWAAPVRYVKARAWIGTYRRERAGAICKLLLLPATGVTMQTSYYRLTTPSVEI
jgi:hypothetical protein